jgi:FkbM family methyltransferase
MHWKQKALDREATIARLRAALERAESKSRDLHARLDRRRHSDLSQGVLRQVLAARAGRLPLVRSDAADAAAREAAFAAASPAYGAAVAAPPESPMHCVDIDGLRWWVPFAADDTERVERARRQGFPYRAILQTRELAIGGCMIDVGANIGRTSLPRLILGDVRAVYAAEPEPSNYACLVRNVTEHGLRGFVLPDRVAVGAIRGEAHLRRSRCPGGHRIVGECGAKDATIAVQLWPLDAWVAQVGLDADAVTFVKVDTQGSEVAVMTGAPALLARRHVSWQIEVDPALLRRASTDLRELIALVQRHFDHYIDIGTPEGGPRVRSTHALAESLAYLGDRQTKTDLLLFHA